MLIDNVGLHRIFGLPVRERDWEAMFEGRILGDTFFSEKSGKRAVRGVFALGGRQAGGRMGNGDDPWTVAGCDQEPEFV